MSGQAFPALSPSLPFLESSFRKIAQIVNNCVNGKINVVITVTLTANVGSTIINDSRIGPNSYVGLGCPLTANAAAAVATSFISSRGKQTCTVTHANNAQVDRTFAAIIIG